MAEWLTNGRIVWLIAALAAVLLLAVALIVFFVVRRRRAAKKAQPIEAQTEEITEVQPPAGQILIGKLHEQGARESQQDCFAVSDEALAATHGLLAVVADGMGGLANGDRVSTAAVQAVLDAFADARTPDDPEQTMLALARSAVQSVNDLLGQSGLRKSGTTLVAALIREEKLTFLSVGDSRICLYRDGALTQLNREHIYKNDLALRAVNGEMSLAAALSDPQGGGLVSFLGMGKLAYIDMPAAPLALRPGDKVVLMSDGVYNALDGGELAQALAEDPETAVKRIRSAIAEKNYSNQDNYTAVILGRGIRNKELQS